MTMQDELKQLSDEFRQMNLSDDDDCKKMSESIDRSNLPRFYREILKVSWLTKNPALVPMAVALVLQTEELRHKDSCAKAVQKAMAERISKEIR